MIVRIQDARQDARYQRAQMPEFSPNFHPPSTMLVWHWPGGLILNRWTGFSWSTTGYSTQEELQAAIAEARQRGTVCWAESDSGQHLADPPRVLSWIDVTRRHCPNVPDADADLLTRMEASCRSLIGRFNPEPMREVKIPKTVHQIWIGPLPPPQRLIDTWRERNPDWEHVLWRDEHDPLFADLRDLIDAAPLWRGKADLMRLRILEKVGGVYVDADSWCLKPLTDDLRRHEAWAVFYEPSRPGMVNNAAMGGAPGARIYSDVLANARLRMKSPTKYCDACMLTGPGPLSEEASRSDGIYLYPSSTFYPDKTERDGAYAWQEWGSLPGVYERLCAA